jgi:hypothetical protein
LFDTLWKKAIPAKRRIREIEEGLKREVIETIQDPNEILELIPKIISSANEEILILFSTVNAFQFYEKEVQITALLKSQIVKGVRIRLLVDTDERVEEKVQQIINAYPDSIAVQYLTNDRNNNNNNSMHTRLTMIIVDREISLLIESRDLSDSNTAGQMLATNTQDIIGLGTYSNSHSTVLSYVSIFETLDAR